MTRTSRQTQGPVRPLVFLPTVPSLLALLALPALLAALAGCTASSAEVAPPQFAPYYPTGLALSPDERWLFVVSSNSDLRYDSGTLSVVDLDAVDRLVAKARSAPAELPATCTREALRPETFLCSSVSDDGTPADYVVPGATVKLGNFAVGVAVQELNDGRLRAFTTVRGDPSITWADFDPTAGTLACGGDGSFPRCDEAHRLDELRGDAETPLALEPFQLALDGANERLFVTHLTTGRVTLLHAPRDAVRAPILLDDVGALFRPGGATGGAGAVGIAVQHPGDSSSLVWVTGRHESRLATVYVATGPEVVADVPGEELLDGPSFLYPAFAGLAQDGAPGDARAIAFLDATTPGDRAYLLSRTPPSLLELDTTRSAAGEQQARVLATLEVCAQPATLAVAQVGGRRLGWLPCFGTGQVQIIDLDRMTLLATTDAGRGPHGVVAAASRKRVFVSNYAEDTIAVLDAEDGTPTQHRVVLHLGRLRAAGVN